MSNKNIFGKFIDSIKRLDKTTKLLSSAIIIIFLIIIAGAIYGFMAIKNTNERLAAAIVEVRSENTSTTNMLGNAISEARTAFNSSLNSQKETVQAQLGTVKAQVGNISGTVNTLQKLSQTDPQLLAKYSKAYFLNENYAPARLSEIPSDYEYSSKKQLIFLSEAWPHLKLMLDAASSSKVTIYVLSAYRSFFEQQALKGKYAVVYGAGTANSFSADQGYSEHQLGTAVDLIIPGLGGELDDRFASTAAYEWLTKNAWKYGFILSYPKGNDYYVYEPWHWRYVGIKLATDLHDQGKYFYDLDQRTIDTYLVNVFDM